MSLKYDFNHAPCLILSHQQNQSITRLASSASENLSQPASTVMFVLCFTSLYSHIKLSIPFVALTYPAPFYLMAIVPAVLPALNALCSALDSITQHLLQVIGQMTLVSLCLTLPAPLPEVILPCPELPCLDFLEGTSLICCSACLFLCRSCFP